MSTALARPPEKCQLRKDGTQLNARLSRQVQESGDADPHHRFGASGKEPLAP